MDDLKHYEDEALGLEWAVPWVKLRDGTRWFVGGYSNVAVNVVDRYTKVQQQHVALSDERRANNRQFTYETLTELSARIARWMTTKGFHAGTRVALYGRCEIETYVMFLACQRVGAVATLLLWSPSDTLVGERLKHCEVALVFTADSVASDQIRRLRQRKMYQGDHLVVDSTQAGEETYENAVRASGGGVDASLLEAGSVSILTYGDSPLPYAYSGIGTLIALGGDLIHWLEPERGKPVTLMGEQGGLYHHLVLTALLMGHGIPVVWETEKGHDAPDLLGTVVMTGLPTPRDMSRESVAHIMWLSPPSQWTESLRNGHRGAAINHRTGQLVPWDSELEEMMGPGGDLVEKRTAAESHHSVVNDDQLDVVVSLLEQFEAFAWSIKSTTLNHSALMVLSSHPRDELEAFLRINWPLETPGFSEVALLCAEECPVTIEGAPALSAIQAVVDRQQHIAVDGIKNPDILEGLRRQVVEMSP